jgi:hypothetical protein
MYEEEKALVLTEYPAQDEGLFFVDSASDSLFLLILQHF